jgi:hypothetical protein
MALMIIQNCSPICKANPSVIVRPFECLVLLSGPAVSHDGLYLCSVCRSTPVSVRVTWRV